MRETREAREKTKEESDGLLRLIAAAAKGSPFANRAKSTLNSAVRGKLMSKANDQASKAMQ